MDYNIYIHNKTIQDVKPTQPQQPGQPKPTKPKTPNKEPGNKPNTNTSGGFAVSLKNFKNIAKGGKVAIALKVAKDVSVMVMTKIKAVADYASNETGDYRLSLQMGNAISVIQSASNPVGTLMNDIRRRQNNIVANKKQEQQRLLLGDVFINSGSRKV